MGHPCDNVCIDSLRNVSLEWVGKHQICSFRKVGDNADVLIQTSQWVIEQVHQFHWMVTSINKPISSVLEN